MKIRHLLMLLMVIFTFTSSVHATLIYNADASSNFTLVSSGGMVISAEPGSVAPMSTTTGSGIASIDADFQSIIALTPFMVGDSLIQLSEVSGSAGAASGSSSASSMNDFLITLDNSLGLTDAIAEFTFTYSWLVELTQTDPIGAAFESGFASAFFHLDGFSPSGAETLAVSSGGGIVPMMDYLDNPIVSFDFSDLDAMSVLSGTTTISAFVTVPTGSIDQFSVITDATGGAVRIPEPASLMVLALGIVMLAFSRKYLAK